MQSMTQEVTRYFDSSRAIIFHWNEGLRGKGQKKVQKRESEREREIDRETIGRHKHHIKPIENQ